MELRKRISPRIILAGLYILFFLVYIIVGLQPAEAANSYEISTKLSIPSIELDSDVTTLYMEDHKLETPDDIVGEFTRAKNKTLLIGHAKTVFKDLYKTKVKDEIIYNDKLYIVSNIETLEKLDINMNRLLSEADEDTIVIMTCAGTDLGNGDATHRLIVTAKSS